MHFDKLNNFHLSKSEFHSRRRASLVIFDELIYSFDNCVYKLGIGAKGDDHP